MTDVFGWWVNLNLHELLPEGKVFRPLFCSIIVVRVSISNVSVLLNMNSVFMRK